jgi:LacI family transcriptional regulator
MATTIKEVAKLAGVSIATVSRVLNNVEPVDERTKQIVRNAARDLHYVPNALGRGLSRRRSDAIGLLLPDLFGEFFSEVIRGCDQTAQQHHYHLVVSSSHSNKSEIEAAIRTMRGRVDGLIIMSPHIDAQIMADTLPETLPVVLLNCSVEGSAFDSLTLDNYGGAYAMTRHLLDHGHRRIAFIRGTANNGDAETRMRGYRNALADGGGEQDPALEVEGDFSEASGYRAVQVILGMQSRPTAVFACNDSEAIGALGALRDAGVRIPDDIALAGFDDIPIASYLSPRLTSVRVDIVHLGAVAVERLIEAVRLRNRHTRQQTVLPTHLSIRESCGCRPAHPVQAPSREGRWSPPQNGQPEPMHASVLSEQSQHH